MHEPWNPNGPPSSRPPSSTAEILLSGLRADLRELRDNLGEVREDVAKLGGEQRVAYMLTQDAIRKLFHITDVLRVKAAWFEAEFRKSGPPPTAPRGLLTGLTGLLAALGAVLPPLSTLALLIAWLMVALTVGINAETVRALIGLGP